MKKAKSKAFTSRVEYFGAIVQTFRPRALTFVDQTRAKYLGLHSESWDADDDGMVGRKVLSAPLEVHLQLTNKCSVGCSTCYTNATPKGLKSEFGIQEWKSVIDELAAMRVFHVALGGGESAELDFLPELAEYALSRGVIPNLTTSGLYGINVVMEALPFLGQVNVSLDGLANRYGGTRRREAFARVDYAISQIRSQKKETGINVVVHRENYGHLRSIFRYAKRKRLNEVELLRLKPTGRAIKPYRKLRCTDEQHKKFFSHVRKIALLSNMRVRVDCSYIPMLAATGASVRTLEKFAIYGCTAGDWLAAVKADGKISGCSFAEPEVESDARNTRELWRDESSFGHFRRWRQIEEPCRSCDYLSLCRGGCSAVSRSVVGSSHSPDPECPIVLASAGSRSKIKKQLPVVGTI